MVRDKKIWLERYVNIIKVIQHYEGNIIDGESLIKHEKIKAGIPAEKIASVSLSEKIIHVQSAKYKHHTMDVMVWSNKDRYESLLESLRYN